MVDNEDEKEGEAIAVDNLDDTRQNRINSTSNDRKSKTKKDKSSNPNKAQGGLISSYGHSGATMFINGKPMQIDKSSQALNKREKSNWLVHILFIR